MDWIKIDGLKRMLRLMPFRDEFSMQCYIEQHWDGIFYLGKNSVLDFFDGSRRCDLVGCATDVPVFFELKIGTIDSRAVGQITGYLLDYVHKRRKHKMAENVHGILIGSRVTNAALLMLERKVEANVTLSAIIMNGNIEILEIRKKGKREELIKEVIECSFYDYYFDKGQMVINWGEEREGLS